MRSDSHMVPCSAGNRTRERWTNQRHKYNHHALHTLRSSPSFAMVQAVIMVFLLSLTEKWVSFYHRVGKRRRNLSVQQTGGRFKMAEVYKRETHLPALDVIEAWPYHGLSTLFKWCRFASTGASWCGQQATSICQQILQLQTWKKVKIEYLFELTFSCLL